MAQSENRAKFSEAKPKKIGGDTDIEDELTRRAVEEIGKETKRAKMRYESMGSMAWKKSPVQPINKRFLRNMIQSSSSTSTHNNTRGERSTKANLEKQEFQKTTGKVTKRSKTTTS
ncbi:protein POLR1D-like [Symsagittifera roscoffensis]|uniref:protein POLR1D-like n=1 Tax=Symsagittifera roscoffensis TaxID=84072 RepID=UPI00307C012E